MKNLIRFDEYIIGYKNDLIEYLEQELTKIRLDQTIDNDMALNYMQQTKNVLESLEIYNNYTLLGVGENWNSDFVVKKVGIEF